MNQNTKIKLNLDSLKSRREWKRHKVKDGHNIFRILPPFGEASNGYPYRKWQIIWGLTDPESGRARPFASSMTSEKRCPVTEFVDCLKERADNMKAQLQTMGWGDEEINARMKDFNELISNLKPKTVYIYNAADKSGDVGLLELKSTAHKAMKREMNQYIQDYNQDPTSLASEDDNSGVWFDVTREGLGRDTEYDVKKCQTKVKGATGKVSFEDDRAALPEAVVENYDNLAYDLSAVYQIKTFDELQTVLEYNLPGIIELVPDADLSQEPVLEKPAAPAPKVQVARSTAPAQAARPAAKVQVKIDDPTDEEAAEVVVPKPAPKATTMRAAPAKQAPVTMDDAFMAEADAILNDR